MLLALTQLELGTAAIRLHVALHPKVALMAVERQGLVFDTRFLASGRPLLGGGLIMYLGLEGRVVWHPTGEVFEAPCWFVQRDEDFEGAGTPGHATFRTDSPLLRAVEMRLDESFTEVRSPAPLSQAAAEAARAYHSASCNPGSPASDEVVLGLAKDLLRVLVKERMATGVDTLELAEEAPRHLEVVWEALAAVFENLDLGATQDALAGESLLSTRQVHRDMVEMLERFRFPAKGWRDALHAWRLRLAIVLLSAEDTPILTVAKAVGYARAEAMANAFRAAGLPSPTALRKALLAGTAPPSPSE